MILSNVIAKLSHFLMEFAVTVIAGEGEILSDPFQCLLKMFLLLCWHLQQSGSRQLLARLRRVHAYYIADVCNIVAYPCCKELVDALLHKLEDEQTLLRLHLLRHLGHVLLVDVNHLILFLLFLLLGSLQRSMCLRLLSQLLFFRCVEHLRSSNNLLPLIPTSTREDTKGCGWIVVVFKVCSVALFDHVMLQAVFLQDSPRSLLLVLYRLFLLVVQA
mmetsp:Transcript_116230/g.201772  ORF Transcript_116230/g.201772 Transcript_116230/m.201772 type:complete len:217 (+) Transcript_116230:263-913(+)